MTKSSLIHNSNCVFTKQQNFKIQKAKKEKEKFEKEK